MQAVRDAVVWQHRPDDRVWLAGHSLGSAIATVLAKSTARAGRPALPAFLCNAPFVSAPVERIGDERVRQGIRVATSFITAGVVAVLKKGRKGNTEEVEAFAALVRWVPHVFVNLPGGPHQRRVRGILGPPREDGADRGRRRGQAGDAELGQGPAAAAGNEPLHLFPSAVLTVNRGPALDFKAAHGIHQWWRPDLCLDCTAHYYYS
ncbi:hypothetical protein PR202_gb04918 [Eleusine coracana subsp. coracana]|uniref:Fungal lipase-type domain-containing protein n=1 Tax=Eleusine coracana subsp. coracana TaxID=191504 RepID=A0AAV5E5P6_ELECO|nr:hypothetical protein PR202_gb04918 [Eleusine coracana subsp. coracana]